MDKLSDQKIVDSWKKNVQPWVTAIQQDEIESRLLTTNDAIVDSVIKRAPKTVLDVGCGEGWLVRQLCGLGIDALGVDVVEAFIVHAKQQKEGRFKTLALEQLSINTLEETFDAIVCNFSLLGHDCVDHFLDRVSSLLNENGVLIIQTLHPVQGCGENKYESGWREGSWSGFNQNFSNPAPWYFRTMEAWKTLFSDTGLELVDIAEPLNPKTNVAASVVFTAMPQKM